MADTWAIDTASKGFIDLHPSYLPYNRGMHPYYWSIVDDTPKGVTIHFIDSDIDSGSIIRQEQIESDITDTGEILYNKSTDCIINLFKDSFEDIINDTYELNKNELGKGSFHLAKELDRHSEIDLDKKYRALDLINIMRARSFNNGDSSYFKYNNKKYKINIDINEV